MGMISKELSSSEKENITEITIGKEDIVIAVNNQNKINGPSIEQIKDIFNGKIIY